MNSLKLGYPIDIAVEILHFSGKLLQEHGNFDWIPNWLTGNLGVHGAAIGIAEEKQFTVHFHGQGKCSETRSIEMSGDSLCCFRQDSLRNQNASCRVLYCSVQQTLLERFGKDQEITCFPMAGQKGFLMVSGDGLLLNSFPIIELLQAITHVIACSLDNVRGSGKSASSFLPTEDMAQMWSEMLAGLSHDLRTPLACIKGYVTTLLREDVTWDTETQNDFLNIIVEETEYIEGLISNLLDSSTLSWKGEIELKKQYIFLPQIVSKVIEDHSYRYKSHQFEISFPEGFPHVEADPIRIEQVLRNLVDNAVKYSAENTLIFIKGELSPGEVLISISDHGIGIDESHLSQLFEKFFRVTEGIREHQSGMGLGLPLARKI